MALYVTSKQQIHTEQSYCGLKMLFSNAIDALKCPQWNCLHLFLVSVERSRSQHDSGRSLAIIGLALCTGINSKFYIAHCRTFETLHRLYLLSYTGVRDRSGVRMLGAESIAGSSLRCALVLINNAGTVIALTVRWALRVHYYK